MLPPGTFTGAVVLVTGGGTGLGKAIATEFGRTPAVEKGRLNMAATGRDHALTALAQLRCDFACYIRSRRLLRGLCH